MSKYYTHYGNKKTKKIYRPVVKTPEAPELKLEDIMVKKLEQVITNAIGIKTKGLECKKLSKKFCSENPDCVYSNEYNICMPKYTLEQKAEQKQSYDEFYFESRRLWREGVTDWLRTSICGLPEIMKDIKVFTNKSSLSDSIILFGLIKPGSELLHSKDKNIVVKLTFKPKDPLENTLEVERAIYKNVITNLVNNKHTPNLMSYLGDSDCKGEEFVMSSDQKAIFKDEYEEINSDEYDKDFFYLLVMEKSLSGETLGNWFKKTHEEKDILAVIFQVLYTLVCFTNIGLAHNDLHPGNIFIEELSNPVTLFFQRSGNKFIKLVTKYIPKIYDFDRGSIVHPAVPINIGLDKEYCVSYGTCNYSSIKFDTYQFVAILHQFLLKYSVISDKTRKDIKMKWIIKILNWDWYSAIISESERSHSLSFLQYPTDTEFNPPQQVLTKFLEANWDNSPWEEITKNASEIPKEILFSPPIPTKLGTTTWIPVSTETHMSFSGEVVKIESHKYEDFFNTNVTELITIWISQLIKNSYSVDENKTKLYQELIKIKPDIHTDIYKKRIYNNACIILSLPMYYRMNKECKDSFVYSDKYSTSLNPYIDDVWNLFSNRLPISIQVFERQTI